MAIVDNGRITFPDSFFVSGSNREQHSTAFKQTLQHPKVNPALIMCVAPYSGPMGHKAHNSNRGQRRCIKLC